MKLTAFIPLLGFVINHGFTIDLFTKRQRHSIYYSALLFMFFTSIALLLAFFLWSLTEHHILLKLNKAQAFFWFPLGLLFLNYIYDLTESNKSILFYIYSFTIFVTAFCIAFTNIFILNINTSQIYPRAIYSNYFLFSFLIFTIAPSCLAFYKLFKKIKAIRHKTPIFIKYFFLASIFVLCFASIFLIYLPSISGKIIFPVGIIIVLPASITMYLTTKYVNLNAIDSKSTAKFLFNEITDVILLIDNEGHIIQINPAACHFFNIKSTAIVNINIRKLINSPSYSEFSTYFDEKFIIEVNKKKIPVLLKQTILKSWKDVSFGKLILIKPPVKRKNKLNGAIQKVFH